MSNYEENKTTLIEWRDWAISNLDPSAGAIMWAVSTINDQEQQLATKNELLREVVEYFNRDEVDTEPMTASEYEKHCYHEEIILAKLKTKLEGSR